MHLSLSASLEQQHRASPAALADALRCRTHFRTVETVQHVLPTDPTQHQVELKRRAPLEHRSALLQPPPRRRFAVVGRTTLCFQHVNRCFCLAGVLSNQNDTACYALLQGACSLLAANDKPQRTAPHRRSEEARQAVELRCSDHQRRRLQEGGDDAILRQVRHFSLNESTLQPHQTGFVTPQQYK